MAKVIFRLLKPEDIFGEIISWRIGEPWCHVVIIFDDVVYSSIFPEVIKESITDSSVAMPPRKGEDFELEVNDYQYATMKEWCNRQVGKSYDYLSILGWALRLKQLQTPHRTYCYEFCWDALAAAGLDVREEILITGNDLIEELKILNAIPEAVYNLRYKNAPSNIQTS